MPAMPKWQIALWDSLPDGPWTCDGCGRRDSKFYVQPQLPRRHGQPFGGKALCGDCINSANYRQREQRKTDLAAEPRCEIPECSRRGNYKVARMILMCGRHMKAAELAYRKNLGPSLAFLGLFGPGPQSRESLILLATQKA